MKLKIAILALFSFSTIMFTQKASAHGMSDRDAAVALGITALVTGAIVASQYRRHHHHHHYHPRPVPAYPPVPLRNHYYEPVPVPPPYYYPYRRHWH